MITKLISSFLFFALFVSTHSLLLRGDDPLKNVSKYWESLLQKEKSPTARQARLTGYLEGLLSINVPAWWRNEGTLNAQQKPVDVWVYGSHSKDVYKVGADLIAVEPDVAWKSIRITKTSNNKIAWTCTINDLFNGVVVRPTPIDCEIVYKDDVVYIFGREASVRFLVAVSATAGSKQGHFAYLLDSPEDISIPKPYGGSAEIREP
jgi:hypothetical protein